MLSFLLFLILTHFNECVADSGSDCLDDWIRCGNGKCISYIWRCDGDNDCGNFKDEENCESGVPPRICMNSEFQCVVDGHCVPERWKCDGEIDCDDKSDERDCKNDTHCHGFRCTNNKCIPEKWRCDGRHDCDDESDEEACPNASVCKENQFSCTNGNCLDLVRVCDGKKDCSDASDEGTHCSDLCSNTTCSHKCNVTPNGPECSCESGYELAADNRTCSDTNECLVEGFCSHVCTNLIGSYNCSCYEGYELVNGSCRAKGTEPLLIFSTMQEIKGIRLRSKRYFPIQKAIFKAAAVDADPLSSRIYWVEISNKSAVYSIKIGGSGFQTVLHNGLLVPEDIAVDYIGRNLYFTDSGLKQVVVCKMDDSMCYALHKDNVVKPRAIVLDIVEAHVYWSDWGVNTSGIYRSGMDGSRRTGLVTENIEWPNGIAIDHTTNRMYWADAHLQTIEYITLDGKNRKMLLKDEVFHPYSLAVFEDNLYWSDWDTYSLETCNKFTGHKMNILTREKGKHIMGVHLYHPVLAREAKNPCWGNPCSHMCLIGPKNRYLCVCPSGYSMSKDGITCLIDSRFPVLMVNDESTIYHVRPEVVGSVAVSEAPKLYFRQIGKLAYDWTSRTLFVTDMKIPAIFSVNMTNWVRKELVKNHIVSPDDIAYDWMSKNLYWVDSKKGTVEVVSTASLRNAMVIVDLTRPSAIALLVATGRMFVSTLGDDPAIFMYDMNGKNPRKLRTGDTLAKGLAVHPSASLLYWADPRSGTIASVDYQSPRSNFKFIKTGLGNVMSIAVNEKYMYWTDSKHHALNLMLHNGSLVHTIELPGLQSQLTSRKVIYSAQRESRSGVSPCAMNNGGCSYMCLTSPSSPSGSWGISLNPGKTCICPYGKVLSVDNHTCADKECTSDEFRCVTSKKCVPREFMCDGVKDCDDGSDEKCDEQIQKCPEKDFQCDNGHCILTVWKCDGKNDCGDNSDEMNCTTRKPSTCDKVKDQMQCTNGECIPNLWRCDGEKDCNDGTDEVNCEETSCREDQIRCDHGQCVPISWACDGAADCFDGTDERNCSDTKTCSFKEFRCDDKKCIDKSLVCDNRADCDDESDEKNCTENTVTKCREGQFGCSDGSCIYHHELCDGYKDCNEGDDELKCIRTSDECSSSEFFCASTSKCISQRWICDGDDDCGDASDEDPDNCTKMSKPTSPSEFKKQDCEEFTCSLSRECVEWSKVCDESHDCDDLTDEGPMCSKSCKANNSCSHNCRKTPQGSQCICNDGYELLSDGITCNDIDECSILGSCSHFCNNTRGGFKCSCEEGFYLSHDHKKCKAVGVHGVLAYLLKDSIRGIDLRTLSQKVYVARNKSDLRGMDYDSREQILYFSDWLMGTIFSFNLNTIETKEIVKTAFRPHGMRLDWLTKNIYYIDDQGYIVVCGSDGRYCVRLLQAARMVNGFDIAPIDGYMFWCVWAPILSKQTGAIERADLDGSNKVSLVTERIALPNAIAVDHVLKKIYWTDSKTELIESIDFHGSQRRIITREVKHPWGITLFEDNVFWSDVYTDRMMQCDVFKGKGCVEVSRGNIKSETMMVMHDARQPKGENRCLNTKCPQLCIPTQRSFICKCAEGYENINSTCQLAMTSDLPVMEVTDVYDQNDPDSKSEVVPGLLQPQFCPDDYCPPEAACIIRDGQFICQCPDSSKGIRCDISISSALKSGQDYNWVVAVVLSFVAIAALIAGIFLCRKNNINLTKVSDNVTVAFRKTAFARKSSQLVVDTDDDIGIPEELLVNPDEEKGILKSTSFGNPLFGKATYPAPEPRGDGDFKRWSSYDSGDSAFVSECQIKESSQLCINEDMQTSTKAAEKIMQFFKRL